MIFFLCVCVRVCVHIIFLHSVVGQSVGVHILCNTWTL